MCDINKFLDEINGLKINNKQKEINIEINKPIKNNDKFIYFKTIEEMNKNNTYYKIIPNSRRNFSTIVFIRSKFAQKLIDKYITNQKIEWTNKTKTKKWDYHKNIKK